jgi:hypothetical protein
VTENGGCDTLSLTGGGGYMGREASWTGVRLLGQCGKKENGLVLQFVVADVNLNQSFKSKSKIFSISNNV